MTQRVHDAESAQDKNTAVPVILPLLLYFRNGNPTLRQNRLSCVAASFDQTGQEKLFDSAGPISFNIHDGGLLFAVLIRNENVYRVSYCARGIVSDFCGFQPSSNAGKTRNQ